MGDANRRKIAMKLRNLPCIFCGGITLATTKEHCPPRALFRDKHCPEGYDDFPACDECNGGSSDQDLLVALFGHLDPEADAVKLKKGAGLMLAVSKQFPDVPHQMFDLSAVQARSIARRLNLRPGPGETYQELGIINIPPAMHSAVGNLATKLTKAIFYKQTGLILPNGAGIQFYWFTNAQRQEHGRIELLELLSGIVGLSPTLTRNGQDLSDQFDYSYSADQAGELHLLQVVFGTVFGFVTFFSQTVGRLEAINEDILAELGTRKNLFKFFSPAG
jgi:hypothetical protein